jgi:hypothetical protein
MVPQLLQIKTDIIASIVVHPIAVMLMIMYVKIFKTDVIVFICDIIMYLTSH